MDNLSIIQIGICFLVFLVYFILWVDLYDKLNYGYCRITNIELENGFGQLC